MNKDGAKALSRAFKSVVLHRHHHHHYIIHRVEYDTPRLQLCVCQTHLSELKAKIIAYIYDKLNNDFNISQGKHRIERRKEVK